MQKICRIIFATFLALASLTACSNAHDSKSAPPESAQTHLSVGGPHAITAPMPSVPTQLSTFYNQEIAWENCKHNAQCAQITVPLDYQNPHTETIKLSLKKRPADQHAIGTLFVNPGGPGGSGKSMIDSANTLFPTQILENFDIIGFDPRGVGDSTPVDCYSDKKLADVLEKSYPATEAGNTASFADAAKIAQSCQEKSGKILPFVGTTHAARDLDILRHLAGDPRLYYLGYSYGTSLGGMYAELFPNNVGRMVLDGAVSSDITPFEQRLAQMLGFEKSLDAYLKNCLEEHASECPFSGSLEKARTQISYLLQQALDQPIPSNDGRLLTQTALLYGIATPLYSQSSWSVLSQAFKLLIEQQNPQIFLTIFDSYTGRNGDKFTNNTMEANWAINCADYPATGDSQTWLQQSAQMAKESPIFGATMQYNEALCRSWAYQPTQRIGPFIAKGAAPIVVIGTTGDPATPYHWSEKFAETLESGHLVTWEGEGHTAYGRSSACIDDPVTTYLLNGALPEPGLSCPTT